MFDIDYNTLSREELVKVATDLRAERNKYRDERDMLRRKMRNDMRRFCEHIVPEFTPLGGNRPDCAVASCVIYSLSAVNFHDETVGIVNPLPPDVLACAAASLCAPVVIDGNLEEAAQLCERRGPARRLSARVRLESEEEMQHYCENPEDDAWPWWNYTESDYRIVFLKLELSPEITAVPNRFLNAPMIKSIDLRSTRLTALGDYCMSSPQLSQVHLPSTLTSIGEGFLAASDDFPTGCVIQSLDLRCLTLLKIIGKEFMQGCESLTELELPSSLEIIQGGFLAGCARLDSIDISSTSITQINEGFMRRCDALIRDVKLPVSLTVCGSGFLALSCGITTIDLRPLIGLTSVGTHFMSQCSALTELHLPASVVDIGYAFVYRCSNITSIDLRHLTGLTSLGDLFMASCDSLAVVHLPDSITELPDRFIHACQSNPVCHWVGSRRGEKRER